MYNPDEVNSPCPAMQMWGSIVPMLLGSFHGLIKFVGRFCLKVPFLHIKISFAQRKSVNKQVVLLKVSVAFRVLLNSATGSSETIPYLNVGHYFDTIAKFLFIEY